MKITCESCQAKYTIADEKVVGKIVKIKCKKCGTTIVVNGNEAGAHAHSMGPAVSPGPGPSAEEEAETRIFGNQETAAAIGADEWTVNVTDDDQRNMTSAQVAAEYRAGVINNDTYVWKDGMPDWLPFSEVPELVNLASGHTHVMGTMSQQVSFGAPKALGGTVVMDEGAPSPFGAPRPGASPAPAAATAARRPGGRGAAVDLFGAAAAREPAPAPAAIPSDRAVGERNENSVLFSLSALTATENAMKAQSKGDQAIIDMRPSPSAPSRNGGRAGFDDIMNLGGGGIGGISGPMLAPPPLMAPVIEPPPPPPPPPSMSTASVAGMPMLIAGPTPRKNQTGLIVGALLGLVVIVGAAVFLLRTPEPPPATTPDQTAAQQVTAAPSATETAAAADTAAPSDTSAASGSPSAVGAAPSKTGAPVSGSPVKGEPASKPSSAPTAEAKAETKPAETKPAETAAAAPAGDGSKEFNRGAASSALGAAAGSAKSCKKADGPTGSGKVKVTFAPSGNVTSASVVGGPFAGTSVGGCIASAFRSAKVPPFDGSPVSVTKSFTIN